MKMPAAFQQYFNSLPDKRLFVTSLDRRIARLYSIADWRETEQFFESIAGDFAEDARVVLFNAAFLGVEAEMDAQGRITFPPELRRRLGLENQALQLWPIKDHIEILSEREFEELDHRGASLGSGTVAKMEALRKKQ